MALARLTSAGLAAALCLAAPVSLSADTPQSQARPGDRDLTELSLDELACARARLRW